MRMHQSDIENIVARRNAKLRAGSVRTPRVTSAQLSAALGPASAEAVALVRKAIGAQTRMMRTTGITR